MTYVSMAQPSHTKAKPTQHNCWSLRVCQLRRHLILQLSCNFHDDDVELNVLGCQVDMLGTNCNNSLFWHNTSLGWWNTPLVWQNISLGVISLVGSRLICICRRSVDTSPQSNHARPVCTSVGFYSNKYMDEDCSCLLEELNAKKCHFAVVGKEVGEGGTPHLQGFAYFKQKVRFNSVKKRFGSRASRYQLGLRQRSVLLKREELVAVGWRAW